MRLEPFGATGLFILGRGAWLLVAGAVTENEEEEEEERREGRGNQSRQRGCPGRARSSPENPRRSRASGGGEERGEDPPRLEVDTSQSQGCPTVPQKTREMKK